MFHTVKGAGRPPTANPLCKKLQLPLTQAQYDKLKGEADRRGSTMSAVLRNLIAEMAAAG
jgi:hypothetical protein